MKSHKQDSKEYIDGMELINTITADLEAGQELVKSKKDEVVYHTSHEEIFP